MQLIFSLRVCCIFLVLTLCASWGRTDESLVVPSPESTWYTGWGLKLWSSLSTSLSGGMTLPVPITKDPASLLPSVSELLPDGSRAVLDVLEKQQQDIRDLQQRQAAWDRAEKKRSGRHLQPCPVAMDIESSDQNSVQLRFLTGNNDEGVSCELKPAVEKGLATEEAWQWYLSQQAETDLGQQLNQCLQEQAWWEDSITVQLQQMALYFALTVLKSAGPDSCPEQGCQDGRLAPDSKLLASVKKAFTMRHPGQRFTVIDNEEGEAIPRGKLYLCNTFGQDTKHKCAIFFLGDQDIPGPFQWGQFGGELVKVRIGVDGQVKIPYEICSGRSGPVLADDISLADPYGSGVEQKRLETALTNYPLYVLDTESGKLDEYQLSKNDEEQHYLVMDIKPDNAARIDALLNSLSLLGSQAESIGSISLQATEQARKRLFTDLKPFLEGLQKLVTETKEDLAMTRTDLAQCKHTIALLQQQVHARYDGTCRWLIKDYQKKVEAAQKGITRSIYSEPFYTGRTGYKMCLRLYPMGDGTGKNTHLSLFFVIMKGEYDAYLNWPFTCKVTLGIKKGKVGNEEINVSAFNPAASKSDSYLRCLNKEMNTPIGCPRLISLDELYTAGYIQEDKLMVFCKIDISGVVHP